MKVYDRIEKKDLDLTTAELIDLMVIKNRQVDLTHTEPQHDEDGMMTYNGENWTTVDGKRFIRSYSMDGRVLSEYSTYNKYDMKGYFAPEKGATVTLN